MDKVAIILPVFQGKYGLEANASAQLDLILMVVDAFNVSMGKNGTKSTRTVNVKAGINGMGFFVKKVESVRVIEYGIKHTTNVYVV